MSEQLEVVIGLEVHVQLKTQTKMFAPATCDFGVAPNTQVDPVSLGLPGTLPIVNEKAVDLAIVAALALGCKIHERSTFDRKHYFYPDMPKNYQITQYDEPYCTGGGVKIKLEGEDRFITLTRIHMEEDAGKLVHQERGNYSEVDLNRAGTPLIEIVTDPVIRSSQEAGLFLKELRRTLLWCRVSDCEMQEGSLRADANVSIRPVGSEKLGTKVEIKNLNSFSAVEAAIEAEIRHQTALWRAGRYTAEVVRETKLWDPEQKCTKFMRGKQGDSDYLYLPDPDLPQLVIGKERLSAVTLPELPSEREQRFVTVLVLNPIAANELTQERAVADWFETLITKGLSPKAAANWTREEALRRADQQKKTIDQATNLDRFVALVQLVESGKVARVVAKGACDEVLDSTDDVTTWFQSRGMIQERDEGQLAAWVATIIAQEPKVVAEIKAGKTAAAGRLVGLVMKLSGGKADPKAVKAAIEAACAG